MKLDCEKYKKSVFAGMVLLGLLWLAMLVWDHNDRYPAAIPKNNFFAFLDKKDTVSLLEKEVIESIQIKKIENRFQIDIRNFFVRSENSHICDIYDSYQLTFEAEGIATNGQRPTMVINSPFQISAKTNLPRPIYIPIKDIFELKPTNTDISFQVNPSVSFQFRNISEMWPEYWVLSEVLLHAKTNEEILIDRKKIYENSKKPLAMDWE